MLKNLNLDSIIGINRRIKVKDYKVGDAISLHYESYKGYWNLKNFVGICIAKKNKGHGTRMILRNVVDNTIVEYSFFLLGIDIVKLEILPIKKVAKITKGKLYLLRKRKMNDSRI